MSRGPWIIKPTEVTKAVKAVVAAGLSVARVEFSPGRIIVIAGKPEQFSKTENEWDSVT